MLPTLLKLFMWRVGGSWGDFYFLESVILLLGTWNTNRRVAWQIIVYKVQTLLTGSNEPGPGYMILDPWIWTHDFDLATLDDIRYHRISYIIVYYCILEWWSSFQPKYHCSQHFQFSVKNFSGNGVLSICWLISFLYLHRLCK